MTIESIKQLLPTLNKDAFLAFIKELWKLENIDTPLKYNRVYSIDRICKGYFEQHYWEKDYSPSIPKYQGYNLLIPYFKPIELFTNLSSDCIVDEETKRNLKYYEKYIRKREGSWQYWTDGNYCTPYLQFFTNLDGIEHNYFYDKIIPAFELALDNLQFSALIAVGSFDTYIDQAKSNVLKAFKSFISNYHNQLSISFTNENPSIDYFIADKYITSGLLKNSKYPYESIFLNKDICKTEVINEFEHLIKTNCHELPLENFLKKHFKEIFGEHYDRIETQLWLKFPEYDISGKNRRLDVFIRNSIERDWELIEIKRAKKITSTYRDIPTFTSEILHAIHQLKNYQRILSQDHVRNIFLKEGIEYYQPELRLVVGNKPDISLKEWRFLKSTNEKNIKIITFQELIESMKIRYSNNIQNAR